MLLQAPEVHRKGSSSGCSESEGLRCCVGETIEGEEDEVRQGELLRAELEGTGDEIRKYKALPTSITIG